MAGTGAYDPMPQKRRTEVTDKDLQGLKYFKLLRPLLERLHGAATQRDHAGNRKLFFDQYGALILLYFFNPILTSLRGLQQAGTLQKVQKQLGCTHNSLGSLSEASRVFDAELLQPLIAELAAQALPLQDGQEAEALRGLTAADGSLLPALPKMAWALWLDDGHRAAKLHLQFDVFKGVPTAASVTAGNGAEHDQLRARLQPGRLYAMDRGYAEYQLFQDAIDAGSSFIGRIRDNAVYQVVEERPLTAEAKAAGVLRDRVVWLGCAQSGKVLRQPLRLVEVATGKTDSQGRPEVLLLATDRMDLDASLVALGYKHRWAVELFFRWFKCILGCRHLLSTGQNGVTIQVYLALIASLLISLWTGRKPSKRTFEMLCLYFSGWASEEELLTHLAALPDRTE
jgi:Transposase DDE domain